MVVVSGWDPKKSRSTRKLSSEAAIQLILEAFEKRDVVAVIVERPAIYGWEITMRVLPHGTSLTFTPSSEDERIFHKIADAINARHFLQRHKPTPSEIVTTLLTDQGALPFGSSLLLKESILSSEKLAKLVAHVIGWKKLKAQVSDVLQGL